MWGLSLGASFFALSSIITLSTALQFTPGSDCAALCTDGSNSTLADSNASATNSSEIACSDKEFSSSGQGIRYKNCINCLQKSDASWKEESDVHWFMYNVRYAFDVCLFSFPEAVETGTINSPCNIDGACAPLEDALTESLLNADSGSLFNYCSADSNAIYSSSYKECVSCLRSTSSQKYLANFLVALKAGCKQRPELGDVIGLSGTIFTDSAVNITDPDTNEVLPGDGGAPVGAMTTGTIVGIAVGCGLALVAAACLLWIYCRRGRRRGGVKIHSPPPDAPMNDPSNGIRKDSYFMDHKGPQTGEAACGGHARNMSNAEYYDLLQGVDNGTGMVNYHYAPHSTSNAPNGALPAHPAYLPRVVSRLSQSSPTPPRNIHKTAMTDSYALQAYMDASNDQSGMGITETATSSASNSRSASRQSSPTPQAITTDSTQLASQAPKPKAAGFGLSSLSKLVIPKKSTAAPQLNVQEPTPISAFDERPTDHIRISRPLAVLDPRFQDKPLAGGQVIADRAPESFTHEYFKRREENKSPLLSGSSRVYG